MTADPRPSSTARTPRYWLGVTASLMALEEFKDTFIVSFWIGALLFSGLFLAGVLWIRRGTIGGPIFVAALFTFELISFPSWARHSTYDWVNEIAAAAISLAGLLLAIAVIGRCLAARRATRASRSHAMAT
jgi:hypothetical protein